MKLKFTDGKIDFDREHSVFVPTRIFSGRLKIPQKEAEEVIWANLRALFNSLEKPYLLTLTTDEKTKDNNNQFDEETKKVRISEDWLSYMEKFNEWASEQNRTPFDQIFEEGTATAPPDGIISFLTVADRINALIIYEDGGYDPAEGMIRFNIADPIENWIDPAQVTINITSLRDDKKRAVRLKRIAEILKPLSGRPRCKECIEKRLNSYYRRFVFSPIFAFDNKNSSPLQIKVVESTRVANISWGSLEKIDQNIDKILYSLLIDKTFRDFIKNRAAIIDRRNFEYQRDTGKPGPYLSIMILQIQQLLVNQIGYTISFAQAQGSNDFYNIVIQKNSDSAEIESEKTPEAVPAVTNIEGVITPHDQEKRDDEEFTPDVKSSDNSKPKKIKDKKYYRTCLQLSQSS